MSPYSFGKRCFYKQAYNGRLRWYEKLARAYFIWRRS